MSSSSLFDGFVCVSLVFGYSETEEQKSQEATTDNDDGPDLPVILAMEVFDALESMTGGILDVRDELVMEEVDHGDLLQGRKQGGR